MPIKRRPHRLVQDSPEIEDPPEVEVEESVAQDMPSPQAPMLQEFEDAESEKELREQDDDDENQDEDFEQAAPKRRRLNKKKGYFFVSSPRPSSCDEKNSFLRSDR
jgi:hypothetical protein